MTRALTVVTSLTLAIGMPLAAGHAQQPRPLSSISGEKPTPPVNVDTIVFKGMTLTAAQKDSIAMIRRGFSSRLQQLNSERIADDVERSNRFAEIRAWQVASMRAVLTPEQQLIFDVTSSYWREADAKLARQREAQRDSLARLQWPPKRRSGLP